EDNRLSEVVCFIAKDEVVGTEICGDAKPAHSMNGFAAEGHGRAERELHAFDGTGDEDAGCHFDAHANGLKPRPETALDSDAAIKASDGADLWIGEWQGDGSQVIGRNTDVAVADDEDVMGCV